jgi:hypothetical protein
MIAYQNRLLTLTFMEDTDILMVTWTNSAPYDLVEVQQSIDKVIETINKYECRKLLIDASEANLPVEDEAITTALTDFAIKLGETGIKKLARIITSEQAREVRVQAIRDKFKLPFQIYDISNREQALHWLKEN